MPDLGDFGVITIEKGTYFDKNFYWWDNNWRMINTSGVDDLEGRIEQIETFVEENNIVYSYDENKTYKIAVVPDDTPDATILSQITPDPEKEIVIFTTTDTISSTTIPVNIMS